jgi:hypothetical protein
MIAFVMLALTPLLAAVSGTSSTVTVTTFAPGDPPLASSDPSNPTGLLVGVLVTLVIICGALILYLRHRRRPAPADRPTPPEIRLLGPTDRTGVARRTQSVSGPSARTCSTWVMASRSWSIHSPS